ncbi:Omp28-related outer membrane protein [Taibaiella lutea]|uniref:Omp28-related outer membrane protein n=1 Tax=Taibaiella lutea TaxID=2608001 RepID=A0A5M6CBE4_9BACT|nr:Omp28-related outer membrane protein [Taibaiella lutea]KAA5532351.1 Omp28-related outer membrane protein [Taibaiella lutea]
MKKTLLYIGLASMLFASCKETLAPIGVTTDDGNSSDTSYYEAPDTMVVQQRRIYVEELTGAQCPNCPDGAEELHKLNTTTYPGELSIIAFHTAITGTFCIPIDGVSKQDFRTDDGKRIFTEVWGTSEGKPSAIFDRAPLSVGSNPNKLYNEGKGGWSAAIIADKDKYKTTPVNIYLSSTFNSEKNRYDIVAKVKYTEAVTEQNALHIFLSQDSIIDAQLFPGGHNVDTNYVFNHVFRKALTDPVKGKLISSTKSAGWVYEYKTSIVIDPASDASQKYWVAKDMHVTAFVAVADNSADIHVMQVQDAKLKGE